MKGRFRSMLVVLPSLHLQALRIGKKYAPLLLCNRLRHFFQLQVEDWIRRNWVPDHYGQSFHQERVRLSSGGMFEFDGVSKDEKIVVTISTSGTRTATGRNAAGKVLKVRSDVFFLLLAEAERRICVLTEPDMHDYWLRERESGRVPKNIEFVCADIPQELREKLLASRRKASKEVSP